MLKKFTSIFSGLFHKEQKAKETIPDTIPAFVSDPIRAQLIEMLFSEEIPLPTKPYKPKLVTFEELEHVDGMHDPLVEISTSEGLVQYLYTGCNWTRRNCYSVYNMYHYIPVNPLLDGSLSLEESVRRLDSASLWVYSWFHTTYIWNKHMFNEHWVHPIISNGCVYELQYGLVVAYNVNEDGLVDEDSHPSYNAVSKCLIDIQKIVTLAQTLGVPVSHSNIFKDFSEFEGYAKNISVQLRRVSVIPQLPITSKFDGFVHSMCTTTLSESRIPHAVHTTLKEIADPRIIVEYNGKLHRIVPETYQWKGSTLIVTMDESFNEQLFS